MACEIPMNLLISVNTLSQGHTKEKEVTNGEGYECNMLVLDLGNTGKCSFLKTPVTRIQIEILFQNKTVST